MRKSGGREGIQRLMCRRMHWPLEGEDLLVFRRCQCDLLCAFRLVNRRRVGTCLLCREWQVDDLRQVGVQRSGQFS